MLFVKDDNCTVEGQTSLDNPADQTKLFDTIETPLPVSTNKVVFRPEHCPLTIIFSPLLTALTLNLFLGRWRGRRLASLESLKCGCEGVLLGLLAASVSCNILQDAPLDRNYSRLRT